MTMNSIDNELETRNDNHTMTKKPNDNDYSNLKIKLQLLVQ
jgi:hypothetical protein